MKKRFPLTHLLALALCICLLFALGACQTPLDSPQSGQTSSPATSSQTTSPPPGGSSMVEPPQPVISGVTAENFPRIDGSTANLPLIAQVYATVCDVSLEEAQTMVNTNGTSSAWRNLVYDECDMLLVYEAAESVQKDIEASGVELEITPIGRDALVFLVNAQNTLDNLTQQQLIDIYTGKVTDWSELGGQAGEIAPFQRNAESGSQTLFLKLLMKDIPPMQAPTELVEGMMGALIDAVASYDGSGGAIGYSVYYYVNEMYQNPDLKLLSVDGVAPSAQNIQNQTYPLVNDFYLVIRADEPEGSPTRLLRDWLLSQSGSEVLAKAGYVPVN